MNIQEIEVAITKLPTPDLLKLAAWLTDYHSASGIKKSKMIWKVVAWMP